MTNPQYCRSRAAGELVEGVLLFLVEGEVLEGVLCAVLLEGVLPCRCWELLKGVLCAVSLEGVLPCQ